MARGPEGGPKPRIVSVSTVLFDGYPMETALEEIAGAGALHVEPAFIKGYVDFTEDSFAPLCARRLRSLIESAGLGVHAVSAHMDLSHDDAKAMLARRIAFTREIGAQVLITNAGPELSERAIIDTIRRVLPEFGTWKGTLAIENPGHGSGDLAGSAAKGRRIVDALGSEHVRLNHDAGNVYTYSRGDVQPADDFRTADDVIGHVHLKDVGLIDGDWVFCAAGHGDVDLKAYLSVLPPALPLSLELPLRLRRPNRGDPQRQAIPRTLAYLREQLEASMEFLKRARSSCDPV